MKKLNSSILFSGIFGLLMFIASQSSAQDIEDVLKQYLKNNYPWAEIEINDLSVNTNIPDEDPERILIEKGPPGRTVFLLEFKGNKKIAVSCNVKVFDWVVMSRKSQRKDYILQKEDVYITLMDAARIPKGSFNSAGDVIGKPLARSIVANMPIIDNMIVEMPAAKKGQKVVLLIESAGFNITATGEMKESGRVGDYVRVINSTSKKVITGMLIDENTVKVEF